MSPAVPYEPMPSGSWLRRHARTAGLELAHAIPGVYELPGRFLAWRHRHMPAEEGTAGAPVSDDVPGAVKVAVLGDAGEGSPAQAAVAARLKAMAPDALVLLGDTVYPTGRERDWRYRFDPPQFFGQFSRDKFVPALGNHEYYRGNLEPYFKRFPQTQGRAYYSTRIGAAEMFVLDTEQRLDPESAQLGWLDAALGASNAQWKILTMHRPAVSASGGGYGGKVHEALGAVLAKHGVQLVLAGHEHSYSRTKPINDTTFVTSGGGGSGLYPFRRDLPDWAAFRSSRNHFLSLSITPERLVMRAVGIDGKVFDTAVFDAAFAAASVQPTPAASALQATDALAVSAG